MVNEYGDKCQFAHGYNDLKDVNRHPKYKTDYCKTFHSKGFCPYGPRCHFIHELSEKFDFSLMNAPMQVLSSSSSSGSALVSPLSSSSSSSSASSTTEASTIDQWRSYMDAF